MLSAVVILATLLAGVAGLILWSRRGETSVDPLGVRSLATFECSEDLLTEREREAAKGEGRGALGEGVSVRLAERLRASGVAVDAPAHDEYGFTLAFRAKRDPVHVLLGAMEDDAGPMIKWALSVVDHGGTPGPRDALLRVDAALREVAGVEALRWHKRELHVAGDLSSASESPVDD